MIELETIEGKATKKQILKMWRGAKAEFNELNEYLLSFKEFINSVYHCISDKNKLYWIEKLNSKDLVSTEAVAQKIGYIESKIMESIGTIDKIALELATQIDKVQENDIDTTNPKC